MMQHPQTSPGHHRSRRFKGTSQTGPWRCGNCDKAFALKEYRYKHQQRCILASSRPKLSKQKSCVACATSKLRCDQNLPACSRCLEKKRPCQYVPLVLRNEQTTGPGSISEHVNTDDGWTTLDFSPGELPPTSISWIPRQPSVDEILPLNHGTTGDYDGEFSTPSMGASAESFMVNDMRVSSEVPWLQRGSMIDDPDPLIPNLISPDFHTPCFTSLATNDVVSVASAAAQTSEARLEDIETYEETLHDFVERRRTQQAHPAVGLRGTDNTPSPETESLVALIRTYPRQMARPGNHPPFVHHKLYPCETGEIQEPLARAFCCVGAFYASLPSSESFIDSMINEESGKLVQSFHRDSSSERETLAIVHAMCVYQILGFFSSASSKLIKATELHLPFFLKMTRVLIRQYQESALEHDNSDEAWVRWLLEETIRRTVLLVNSINTLSFRLRKQDPAFYEPLDEFFVRNMAMPAPRPLWKASTAHEWQLAQVEVRNFGVQPAFEDLDDFSRLVIGSLDCGEEFQR